MSASHVYPDDEAILDDDYEKAREASNLPSNLEGQRITVYGKFFDGRDEIEIHRYTGIVKGTMVSESSPLAIRVFVGGMPFFFGKPLAYLDVLKGGWMAVYEAANGTLHRQAVEVHVGQ